MRIQSHSYKPEPEFFGKDSYHLGMELEMEAPDEDVRDAGLAISESPRYCYAKRDGSLAESGWELVTHPISRNLWLDKTAKRSCVTSLFGLIKGLRDLGYTSHLSGRCGLHIHVGYSAFRGAVYKAIIPTRSQNGDRTYVRHDSVTRTCSRRLHVYWFAKLVNSSLYRIISQRDDRGLCVWCNIHSVHAKTFHTIGHGSRYTATNFTERTVEVRIFRGNMRESRIRKAIESIIAAVEFTRNLTPSFAKETLIDQYKIWLSNNRKTYNSLYQYLREVGEMPDMPVKAAETHVENKEAAKRLKRKLEQRRAKACVS